jgi:Family of unknown function (DUF5681)
MDEQHPTRDDKGRWLPGQSGNKGGLRETEFMRWRKDALKVLREHGTTERLQAIFQKLYDNALSGDFRSASKYLEYILGIPNQAIDPRLVDGVTLDDSSIEATIMSLHQALLNGTVPVDVAKVTLSGLGLLIQTRENKDLMNKLESLRELIEAKGR